MRVVGRVAVVVGAAGALLLGTAGVASAGGQSPLLAGYTVGAPAGSTVYTTFVVPAVDCGAAPDSSLFLGASFHGATASNTSDATVGVIATCTDGVASYEMGASYRGVTSGFGGGQDIADGTKILLLLEEAGDGYSQLDVLNLSNSTSYQVLVYESDTATLFQGGSTRSVGGPSPAFAPVTFTSSVDGAPLADAAPTKSRQSGVDGKNVLSVSKAKGSAFRLVYRKPS